MNRFTRDLRHALRSLRHSPGFTVAAVLTLAVGIGASTAIFSVVEAALLRALPYASPDRLVHLWETSTRGEFRRREFSYPDYLAMRGGTRALERVAGYSERPVTLTGREPAERLAGAAVTPNFFATLGVEPVLGRAFRSGEDARGAAPVAIVSRELWNRLYGADASFPPSAPLTLDGAPHAIVGVLPAGFDFALAESPEIWVPVQPTEAQLDRGYMHWFRLIARLAPGASLALAEAEANAVAARREAEDPRFHGGVRARVRPLAAEIVGDLRPLLSVVAAAVACVFLVACANVANLLLGRSVRRRKEIGVRVALGATPSSIARLVLAETLLLAAFGGAAGMLVAEAVQSVLVRTVPEAERAAMPFLGHLRLDGPVLAFAASAAIAAALLCGLLPALRMARGSAFASMKGEVSSAAMERRGASSALVTAEVALTLVVLTAAGLLVRSTLRLLRADPGYRAAGVLTASVWLPPSRYSEPSAITAAEGRILDELSAIPGVRAAASTSRLPIGGGDTGTPVANGRPLIDDAHVRTVSPRYFETMGIPLRSGRPFAADDAAGGPRVAIVNQTFARRAFPGEDPIGRRVGFVFLGSETLTIVGVVGDENVIGPESAASAVFYFSSAQDPSPSFSVVLRASADPEALQREVTRRLAGVDHEIVVSRIASLTRRVRDTPSVFRRRFPAGLIGGFGLIGLALAAIGVFGVSVREVGRRRREIGIRMALGAAPADVLRLIVADNVRPVAIGLGIGALGSAAASRLLRSLLFGVSAFDPPTWIAVAALLSTVAVVAALIPALSAARIDPIASLRGE